MTNKRVTAKFEVEIDENVFSRLKQVCDGDTIEINKVVEKCLENSLWDASSLFYLSAEKNKTEKDTWFEVSVIGMHENIIHTNWASFTANRNARGDSNDVVSPLAYAMFEYLTRNVATGNVENYSEFLRGALDECIYRFLTIGSGPSDDEIISTAASAVAEAHGLTIEEASKRLSGLEWLPSDLVGK